MQLKNRFKVNSYITLTKLDIFFWWWGWGGGSIGLEGDGGVGGEDKIMNNPNVQKISLQDK